MQIREVIKANNDEKVDFAISTYKNYNYTNYYIDKKYITIYDELGKKLREHTEENDGDSTIYDELDITVRKGVFITEKSSTKWNFENQDAENGYIDMENNERS